MDTEYQLADTIQNTLAGQSARAVNHTIHLNDDYANAMLSEWMLPSGECLLTSYLNETTTELKDILLYVSFHDKKLTYGSFWFNPDAQLPTDNI